MGHILSNTEPAEMWDHFYKLSQIPHPSGDEQAIWASTGERIDTARMPRFWEFVKLPLKKLAEVDS